jgi:hypothetical protein
MATTKSLMSVLTSMHSDEQTKFAEALQTIKTAASMLSRPEVVACLAFLEETARAAGSLQASLHGAPLSTVFYGSTNDDAVAASILYEAVNAVPLQDAVKAVAVQDAAKATAVQYAVKTVALREAARADTFSEDEIRSIVSEEAAHAIAMLRHADSDPSNTERRRSRRDRRKHH